MVDIDGRMIGFVDGNVTGDRSLDEVGWEFDASTVAEAEPYQETVTKYRPKE